MRKTNILNIKRLNRKPLIKKIELLINSNPKRMFDISYLSKLFKINKNQLYSNLNKLVINRKIIKRKLNNSAKTLYGAI